MLFETSFSRCLDACREIPAYFFARHTTQAAPSCSGEAMTTRRSPVPPTPPPKPFKTAKVPLLFTDRNTYFGSFLYYAAIRIVFPTFTTHVHIVRYMIYIYICILHQGLKNAQDFSGPAVRSAGGATLEVSMARRKRKEARPKNGPRDKNDQQKQQRAKPQEQQTKQQQPNNKKFKAGGGQAADGSHSSAPGEGGEKTGSVHRASASISSNVSEPKGRREEQGRRACIGASASDRCGSDRGSVVSRSFLSPVPPGAGAFWTNTDVERRPPVLPSTVYGAQSSLTV